MLAAIQSGIEEVDVRDISVPETARCRAGPGKAAGICGSDLHQYHRRNEPHSFPEGHEVAGEVVQLPTSYDGPIRVGDLVAVDTVCLGLACGGCAFCRVRTAVPLPRAEPQASRGGGFAERI